MKKINQITYILSATPSLFSSATAYTLSSLRLPTYKTPEGERVMLRALGTSAYTLMLKPAGSFILSSLYFLYKAMISADTFCVPDFLPVQQQNKTGANAIKKIFAMIKKLNIK